MQLSIAKVAAILASSHDTLSAIEIRFSEEFDATSHASVVAVVHTLVTEGALSSSVLGVECLVGFYLCHIISKSAPGANHVMQLWLNALEVCVRDDARKLEHFKYRAASKDNKKTTKDAIDADTMRVHTALKCFAFQCLLDTVDKEVTPHNVLSETQVNLDKMLDQWGTSPGAIKEKLMELQLVSDNDINRCSLGGICTTAPVAPPHVCAAPCRPAPVQPQIFPGELKYLVTSSTSQLYMLDTKPHTAEWKNVHRLVNLASKKVLTESDKEALINSLQSDAVPIHQLDVPPSVVALISIHNPFVAASIINKIPNGSAHIAEIIAQTESNKIPISHLNTIFLNASKALHQIDINKYITLHCSRINANDGNSNKGVGGDNNNDDDDEPTTTVKLLATTLHQLTTNGQKENHEIYIPDSRKAVLKATWTKFSAVQEVSNWWADFQSQIYVLYITGRTSYDHTVALWDSRNALKAPYITIKVNGPVEHVLYITGRNNMVCSAEDTVHFYDIRNMASSVHSASHHTKTVTCLSYSAQHRTLITGGLDCRLNFISCDPRSEGVVIASKKFNDAVTAVDVSPLGTEFSVGFITGKLNVMRVEEIVESDGLQKIVSHEQRKEVSMQKYLLAIRIALSRFRYQRALRTALLSRSDDVIISTIEEMQRRGALRVAVSGQNDRTIVALLRFATKMTAQPQFCDVSLVVIDVIIEIYGCAAYSSPYFHRQLLKAHRRMSELFENIKIIQGSLSIMDLVIDAAE